VRFPEQHEDDDEVKHVVQPDIVVVCDRSKLDDKGCRGSPDLIIEIVSPGTAKKDMKDKRLLYQQMKVKEYWIVHPLDATVLVFTLKNDDQYGLYEIYSAEDDLPVGILDGLSIKLAEVFGTDDR
jgi:Uma2 family endonuclease